MNLEGCDVDNDNLKSFLLQPATASSKVFMGRGLGSVAFVTALTSTNLTLLEVLGMSRDNRPVMRTDSQK